MKTPYEFNPNDAFDFASSQGIPVSRSGNQLHFKVCPYCHGGSGRDQKTFAIDLKTGQFNCFRSSCGAHGNMIKLSQDFNFSLGNTVDEYINPRKTFKRITNQRKPKPKDQAVEYLKSRGISAEITNTYNVTIKKDEEKTLMFPFYDENDVLTFVKYRKTDFDKAHDQNKEWCEKDCKPILFGMNHINPENKTLVLTEGQIDSLSVAEAGIDNAVSVPNGAKGFTWVPYCWNFLSKFEELIVFGDYENGEITLLPEMKTRFRGRIKHVRPEDYQGCKDANDILRKFGKAAVQEAVKNAVPIKNPRIIEMADVEEMDLSQKEYLSSGIPFLDRTLGGFYFGQLVILTGERGDGKSTLASQFGTFAINEGYRLFYYSGEMDSVNVRTWFNLQTAGSKNIRKLETEDRGVFYSVQLDRRKEIEQWYRGKALMYNNRVLDDDDEGEELLKTLECAISQYECRVLIVDNLMSALEDDMNTDLYRQQSAFVRKLAQMSKQYDVLIFLIVHPRKLNGGEITNDSIAGSANITNLADIVLTYGRSRDDKDSDNRTLTIQKNRMTGEINRNGVTMYFQKSSKRISEDGTFSWTLAWEGGDIFDDDDDVLTLDMD